MVQRISEYSLDIYISLAELNSKQLICSQRSSRSLRILVMAVYQGSGTARPHAWCNKIRVSLSM